MIAAMLLTIGRIAIKTIEIMFFIGLAGCAATVLLSWISVGRDSLTGR
jgi:hypothetical protein